MANTEQKSATTVPAQLAAQETRQETDAYQLPCSLVQRTCWFLDRMSPGSAAYNIAVRFLLTGPLETALLEEALREVCRRHEVLRTRFVLEKGEPKQLVEPHVEFALSCVDLRSLASEERDAEAERLAAEEARIGFDIERGPLFRGTLVQTEGERSILLLTMHHIISDGWSVGLVTDEIGAIYQALAAGQASPLPPLPIQYGDYACWQQDWISTGELDRQLEDLRCALDGFQPLNIPTDFDRPAAPTSQGTIRSILLPRPLTDSLKRFSEQHGCTMFVTMLSAFAALLQIQSSQTEITIRTQTAGRDRVELESLIGWFVNSIILRIDASGSPTFEALVENARKVVLEAFEYQHVPFERLMEVIRPQKAPPRHPPFQVNFIFQRDFVRPWKCAGVTLTPIPSKAAGTFVDLNFFLVEREDGWRASVDVSTDVFHPETGDFFLESYRKVLETVAKNPEVRISDITAQQRPFPPRHPEQEDNYALDNFVPPRNEHEERVVEIWKRVLDTRAIGAYSNFFDLGGHSLKAVRLLSEFQRQFGLEIKISELFVDPTPAAMAQVISGEAAYSDTRDLIPVQPLGSRPPFFQIGGDHWFRPLAKYVGLDQPFIGVPLLKYRHLDMGKARVDVAKELARLLINEHGGRPFLLGGWCAEGLTAYEVARALQAEGESIALVVLFDAVNPDYYREARSLVHSAGRTMTSLRSIIKPARGGLISAAPLLARALQGVMKRLGRRIADRYTSTYSSAPASFPLLVLRPPAAALEAPDLGWRRACRETLTVVEVPGDHASIFREPNVKVLGWKLREQLDIALSALQK